MPANSLPRRALKRLLAPLLSERSYRLVQAMAMGWDIRSGTLTEPELEIIPHAIRAGETAIDIGANYGLYSYHLARATGPRGRVVAFEPVPFTGSTFRLISRLLGFRSVELVAKGAGDKSGELTFRVPVAESGAIIAGLVHSAARDNARAGHERHARFERTREIRAEVVVLDDYLGALTNVSFIKCDIEGADYFALRGARKIIAANHPTVVCEINPWFLEGFGIKLAELVGFFTDMGYGLYRYDAGRLHPTPIEQVVEDNWVFVHPARHDRLAALLPPQA